MRRLFLFLVENPILLVIAFAWLVGMINNARSAMKKGREKAAQRTAGGQQAPVGAPAPVADRPAPPMPVRSAEEVTREMRRILGVEPAEGDAGAGRAQPKPPQVPRTEAERHRAWDRPTVERAPKPVVPSTPARRLPNHVDPHVGEAISRRAGLQPRRTAAAGRAELGDLGGRVHHETGGGASSGRYALSDLKRILVLSEILGPPLALRQGEREV